MSQDLRFRRNKKITDYFYIAKDNYKFLTPRFIFYFKIYYEKKDTKQ